MKNKIENNCRLITKESDCQFYKYVVFNLSTKHHLLFLLFIQITKCVSVTVTINYPWCEYPWHNKCLHLVLREVTRFLKLAQISWNQYPPVKAKAAVAQGSLFYFATLHQQRVAQCTRVLHPLDKALCFTIMRLLLKTYSAILCYYTFYMVYY